NPCDKVLAARTEDHGMYWLKFEGKIESGYGAGEIKIIEKGKVEILEWTENKIIFRGNQKFINGKYALVRTKFGGRKKNGQESWILLKSKYEDH
ncbi:MAG: DNA polymerase ligase N-terminal domain-containing protein, partial [archaeon]